MRLLAPLLLGLSLAPRAVREIEVHVARVADGSRIGELTIPVPDSSAPFALGDAGAGARLVIGLADRWEIHDPCPRP